MIRLSEDYCPQFIPALIRTVASEHRERRDTDAFAPAAAAQKENNGVNYDREYEVRRRQQHNKVELPLLLMLLMLLMILKQTLLLATAGMSSRLIQKLGNEARAKAIGSKSYISGEE